MPTKTELLVIPDEVQQLVDERQLAKEARDWQRADELRGRVEKLGFKIMDTSSGPKLEKSVRR